MEFCQPDPLEGAVPPESALFQDGDAGCEHEDAFRGLRSQLYSCY